MASVKSKKRREEEKQRAKTRMQEQQRREKQSAPVMTPEKITTGFSADMLAIMQHFQGARIHVKQRIAQAEKMKEGNPERFNELRLDAFIDLRDRMDKMQSDIDNLAGLVGTLADLQTMHDKMIFVSQNFGSLTEMQISLDAMMRELQDIDQVFNRSLVELLSGGMGNAASEMDVTPDVTIETMFVQIFGTRDTSLDNDGELGFIGDRFFVDGTIAGAIGDTSVTVNYCGEEYISAVNFDKVSRFLVLEEGQNTEYPDDPTKRWVRMDLKDAISCGLFVPKENRTAEVDMPVTEADAQAIMDDQHAEQAQINVGE